MSDHSPTNGAGYPHLDAEGCCQCWCWDCAGHGPDSCVCPDCDAAKCGLHEPAP